MRWNCEEFVDPNKHRCYLKPIVNQEEDSGEANSKRNGILEEMIGEEEKEEDTQGEEADNNKANNDDSKSVWYRFGSLTITFDLSNDRFVS